MDPYVRPAFYLRHTPGDMGGVDGKMLEPEGDELAPGHLNESD